MQAVAGFQPRSVSEVMMSIRAQSHAALDPSTGDVKFVSARVLSRESDIIPPASYDKLQHAKRLTGCSCRERALLFLVFFFCLFADRK